MILTGVEVRKVADNVNKSFLDAIAANHAEVVSLIDGLAESTQAGFNRVEARLGRVETDVKELHSTVARIETKLDRHETRIESLEARS